MIPANYIDVALHAPSVGRAFETQRPPRDAARLCCVASELRSGAFRLCCVLRDGWRAGRDRVGAAGHRALVVAEEAA